MESEMEKIVAEVSQSDNPSVDDDKMVIVMGVDVPDRETARALLRQPEVDERSIAHPGQTIEEGEVWISIEDDVVEDPSPCFHRADAVDALEMYLSIAPALSKKALAKANVNGLYQETQPRRPAKHGRVRMPRAKSNGGAGLGKPIAFRLSEADRVVYLEKVAASGLTQSEVFRQAVLTNRTQVIARPKASDDRKRLLYVFNKISNNLSQLAHRANSEHVRGKLSEASYEQMLDQLQMISCYLKATLAQVE